MPPARIIALAKDIQDNVTALENYLQLEGLPSPAFTANFPAKLQLPGSIAALLQHALESSDELHSLLLGPMGFILHQLDGTHNMISLHAVNRFKAASKFGPGEEISFADLAVKCEVDKDTMRRILRHAIANHIFTEPRPDYIAHTAISRALVDVPMLHDWVAVACEDIWPPTTRAVDALVRFPASGEPTETAYNLASGTEGSFFQELSGSPERVERFSNAMALFKLMPGFEPSLITEAALWPFVHGTVVDVGGADGTVGFELVKRFPSLKIIIQDLPNVIESARDLRATNLPDQITFQAHDFFTEQTVQGADVYLFRMIFHDWSDKFCKRILQNLIPALKSGARLLINDFCIPEPGTVSLYQERLARCHDLSMKAMFNGKERSRREWEELLSTTDSRFEIVSVAVTPGSPLALFEVIWRS